VFEQAYGARYPKAVETLRKDQEQMLTFFDFPGEHWPHLGTTNPIESTFATVKARTKQTKGAGSRKAGLAMAWKLLMAAQQRWRRVNAPHLAALVKAAVAFPDGEAEMLQCDLESEELFILTPETLAADGVPIHNIWQYLVKSGSQTLWPSSRLALDHDPPSLPSLTQMIMPNSPIACAMIVHHVVSKSCDG
jgi:hypothetical protein